MENCKFDKFSCRKDYFASMLQGSLPPFPPLPRLQFYLHVREASLTTRDLNEFLQLNVNVLSVRKIQANKFCYCMNKQGKIVSTIYVIFILTFEARICVHYQVFSFQPGEQSLACYVLPVLHIIVLFSCLISIFNMPYLSYDIISHLQFTLKAFAFLTLWIFWEKLLILSEIKPAQSILMSVFLHPCRKKQVFSRHTVLQVCDREQCICMQTGLWIDCFCFFGIQLVIKCGIY